MPPTQMYDGRDPRDLPAYGIADAARYLDVPAATLRSWVAGRTYPRQHGVGSFEPLITPAEAGGASRLSFYNLVEAHVLRALRTKHEVPLKHVRTALVYAEKELRIQRLLLSKEMQTAGGDIFLEHLGTLVNLSKSGQLAVRELLAAHLERVERDGSAIPIRLYPFLSRSAENENRPVVIDPRVSFGRPTIAGSGIRTSVLVQRIDAGESVQALAADYGLTDAQVKAAVLFERAA
jgi:uncharacterized protein (DUF433 family)/transposase-like protein